MTFNTALLSEQRAASRLEVYRSVIAVGAVLLLYSEFDEYLYGATPLVPPLYWLALGGLLAIPLVVRHAARLEIPLPQFVGVAAVYGLLLLWGWFRSDDGPMAQADFKAGILSVLLMFLFSTLFVTRQAMEAARRAVIAVVIVSVAVNLYEYVSPFYRWNAVSPWAAKDMCRVGGLYVNPNGSAVAIVLGMVLSIPAIPQKWRSPYVALSGLGVVLTFSRAGYLVWLLAVFGLAWKRTMSIRQFIVMVVLAIVTTFIFFLSAAHVSQKAHYCIQVYPQANHLLDGTSLWGSDVLSQPISDQHIGSTFVRLRLLQVVSKLVLHSNGLGAGLGSVAEATTSVVGTPSGAHNMYLQLFAELGIPGLIFIPWMLWLLIRLHTGKKDDIVPVFVGVYALWALFDHDLLDTFSKLLALSLMFASASIESERAVLPVTKLLSFERLQR